MSGGGGEGRTLEFTPTWVVAVVCTVIVAISLGVERLLHYAGHFLKSHNQKPLYEALQKVKEGAFSFPVSISFFSALVISVGLFGFLPESCKLFSFYRADAAGVHIPPSHCLPKRHLQILRTTGSHDPLAPLQSQ